MNAHFKNILAPLIASSSNVWIKYCQWKTIVDSQSGADEGLNVIWMCFKAASSFGKGSLATNYWNDVS